MVKINGKIDTQNIKREQGLSMIKEYLNKSSLNSAEDVAIREIVVMLEREFNEFISRNEYMLSILNKSQKLKAINQWTNDESLDKILRGL